MRTGIHLRTKRDDGTHRRPRTSVLRICLLLVCVATLASVPSKTLSGVRKAGTEYQRDKSRHARQLQWRLETHPNLDGSNPALARLAAYLQRQTLAKASADTVSWHPIGPWPATVEPYGHVSGRVASLAIDPRHPTTMYLGAAEGGVWKTTNGGVHWTPLTDDQPVLSSGAITVDPVNPEVVYWGTGEPNWCSSLCYLGIGIMKSTNGGSTWAMTGLQRAGSATYKIIVNPTSTNIVFAAMDNGVYRSTDGGGSWNSMLTGAATDLIMDPGTPATMYAAISGKGLYKSTDGGLTWEPRITGLPPSDQIERMTLALCASQPAILYTRIYGAHPTVSGSDTNRVYRSSDNGENWNILSEAPLSWGPVQAGSSGGGGVNTIQGVTDRSKPEGEEDSPGAYGWYNNYIAVDPTDPNVVYVGGIDLWRTTNGGTSWTNTTRAYQGGKVHPDQHAFAFDPSDPRTIIAGNDGGIYRSTDRGDVWTNLNEDLNTIQFYSIAIDHGSGSVTFGGTQDNGTQKRIDGLGWSDVTGGDGFAVNVDYVSSNLVYGEMYYGWHLRSFDGGSTFSAINNGIGEQGNWFTPVTMDPVTSSTLYTGTTKLYKTTDQGTRWTALGSVIDQSASPSNISAIGIGKSNTQVIYVGMGKHGVYRTFNGGGKWTNVTGSGSSGLPSLFVSKILVDPDSSNLAYVTFTGHGASHVYRTDNGGGVWTDISSGLPAVPINTIVEDPADPNTLFVGSDAGVYATHNKGASWLPFMNGLPNVVVTDLEFTHNGALRAATAGRGMWEYSLPNVAVLAVRINPPDGGTVSPGNFLVRQIGDSITVSAQANAGFSFVSWSGDTTTTANPLHLVLWKDRDLTLNFKSLSLPRDAFYTSLNSDRGEIAFNWVELHTDSSATRIQPGEWHNRKPVADPVDDGTAGPFLLGIPFYFYGAAALKESVYVGANGALSLSEDNINDLGSDGAGYYSDGWIIPGAPVADLVSPFWNDLFLTSGAGHGEVYYKRDTQNKKFIVEWYRAGDFNSKSDTTTTFEVILDGSANSILFQYLSVGTTSLDSTALVGIQKDGTSGLPYYLGGKSRRPPELMVHDSLAVSFVPRFAVSIADEPAARPEAFALEQNWPNPFNPVTTIKYTVGVAGGQWQEGAGAKEAGAGGSGLGARKTRLVVYDVLGRQVATLVDELKAPGSYEVRFDARNLASGVYIYRLTAGPFVQSRKMVLLK